MSELNIPRLRELREFHGVSQVALGEALGVTKRTVIRWEMGEHDPKLGDLRQIAAYFGVSVAQLIGEAPLAR